MKAPAAPAADAPQTKPEDDDLYALAPDPAPTPAPAPVAPPRAAPAPAPTASTPLSSTRTSAPKVTAKARPPGGDEVLARLGLAPQRVSHLTEEMLEEDRQATARHLKESPLRDWIVPFLLVPLGIFLSFYELMSAPEGANHTLGEAIPQVLLRLGLSVGLILAGTALAVMFLEVVLMESFRRSILKLCAIAIGPAAIHGILSQSMGELSGSAAGAFATIASFALLFWYLLRLSLQDTAVLVIVTWVLVTFANYMAYTLDGILTDSWI